MVFMWVSFFSHFLSMSGFYRSGRGEYVRYRHISHPPTYSYVLPLLYHTHHTGAI